MEVYIEYAIIINLTVDFALLKTTLYLMKIKQVFWRLFLCSAISTAITVLLPLINLKGAILFAIKIVSGALVVFSAAEYGSAKKFTFSFIVFIMVTFFLGGLTEGAFSLFSLSEKETFVFALVISFSYLVFAIVKVFTIRFYRKRDIEAFTVECEVINEGKKLKARAFMDTGNHLYGKDGEAVIMCSKKFFKKLVDNPLKLKKAYYLNVATVAGNKKTLCFKIDEIKIYNGKCENIFNNVTVAICGNIGEYELILHSSYIGVKGGEYVSAV